MVNSKSEPLWHDHLIKNFATCKLMLPVLKQSSIRNVFYQRTFGPAVPLSMKRVCSGSTGEALHLLYAAEGHRFHSGQDKRSNESSARFYSFNSLCSPRFLTCIGFLLASELRKDILDQSWFNWSHLFEANDGDYESWHRYEIDRD